MYDLNLKVSFFINPVDTLDTAGKNDKFVVSKRDWNSYVRVSRPPLYPLSYCVNGDWYRESYPYQRLDI